MSQVKFLGDTYPIDLSELQMELVAADLAILLKHSGVSRTELAQKLGWKKSRITRVLSGDNNLTLKTISQFVEALGYTFDVVFHNKNYPKPKQPWQIYKEISQKPQPKYLMQIQNGDEVLNDLISGDDDAMCYIRIDQIDNLKQTIQMSSRMLDDMKTTKIPMSIDKELSYEYCT